MKTKQKNLIGVSAALFMTLGLTSFVAPTGEESEVMTLISPERSPLDGMGVEEVNLVLRSRMPESSVAESGALGRQIVRLCNRYNLRPSLVLSLIQAESRFRPEVVSYAGAIGLMQLLPATAGYIATRAGIDSYREAGDLKNPLINVTLGIHYLAYLRDRFADSQHFLAAYNMGPNKYVRMAPAERLQLRGVNRYVAQIHRGMREPAKLGLGAHGIARMSGAVVVADNRTCKL